MDSRRVFFPVNLFYFTLCKRPRLNEKNNSRSYLCAFSSFYSPKVCLYTTTATAVVHIKSAFHLFGGVPLLLLSRHSVLFPLFIAIFQCHKKTQYHPHTHTHMKTRKIWREKMIRPNKMEKIFNQIKKVHRFQRLFSRFLFLRG